MSDFPSRLPARPSLEQLRNQAKELLRAYREGHEKAVQRLRAVAPRSAGGMPVLADSQFVIAREHGFESWAALKHHIEVELPTSLERYDALAQDLVAAYNGDALAAARLSTTFGMEVTVERIRAQVPVRLDALRSTDRANSDITIDDARLLIAGLYGFDNWTGLMNAAARPARAQLKSSATRPASPFYVIDADDSSIELRAPVTDRDWDVVFDVVKELQITALKAGGQMTDAIAERLGELSHLTRLDLSGSRDFTDAGAPAGAAAATA